MRASVKLAGIVAVCGLAWVAVSPAAAQCATGAREFASIGGMQNQKLRVMTDGWHNSGEEIGRFWSAADSNDNNNFAGTCPSNDPTQTFGSWWGDETGNSNCSGMPCFGIRGAIAGTGCVATSCQDDPLIVLVEDFGPLGPPGVRDEAFFFAARIDLDADGAVSPRRWDFALVDDPVNGPVTHGLVRGSAYPTVELTSIGGINNQGIVFVTMLFDIDDPGTGVWPAVDSNTGLPDSSILKTIDYCWSFGNDDPGRERSRWESCQSLPYLDAGVVGNGAKFQCRLDDDLFMAIGLTFDGGAGPDVPSRLVGRAIQIDCQGLLLAEPEVPTARSRELNIGRKPPPRGSRRR